jgi:hypothetical protein
MDWVDGRYERLSHKFLRGVAESQRPNRPHISQLTLADGAASLNFPVGGFKLGSLRRLKF